MSVVRCLEMPAVQRCFLQKIIMQKFNSVLHCSVPLFGGVHCVEVPLLKAPLRAVGSGGARQAAAPPIICSLKFRKAEL